MSVTIKGNGHFLLHSGSLQNATTGNINWRREVHRAHLQKAKQSSISRRRIHTPVN